MRTVSIRHCALLLLALILGGTACERSLDVVPKEFYQESDLLADIKQAEKEVTRLYAALPWDFLPSTGSSNGVVFSSASDEGYANWNQSNARKYDGGSWNSNDNPLGNFNDVYRNIRVGLHFLQNVDKVPIKNATQEQIYRTVIIPRYKLEVKFLIAFNYFELFKRFGPVPIVDRYYEATENPEVLKKPRNSVDEVVNEIVRLCDEAAAGLPLTYEAQDVGRATKGAALALKAKVLLYAASPLFNGGEIDGIPVSVNGNNVKSSLLGVKNTDGKTLFNTTYDREKWKKAADAAKAVLDMGVYSLRPVQQELFYNRDFNEFIFWTQGGGTNNFENSITPNGADYGGTGSLAATQEMIDSYEMKNGYPINEPGSGYVETGYVDTTMKVFRNRVWTTVKVKIRKMYFNRDPRFYTDQFFDGMPYLGRNIITQFVTNVGSNNDGWGGSKATGQNTRTGYYVQKWVAPAHNIKDNPSTNYRNYPHFRLADVYLWYAEAMNEYNGPSADVYAAINAVRNRVGMPSLPIIASDNNKEGLRARIQNERKIEMAYEAQRWYDIRRWLIAHTPACTSVTGMNINGTGETFFQRTPILANGRVFKVQHYLMPIPVSETSIAPALVQNYGW
ncbi:RagB/SusD family nutrient uptake outer membrane protein [Chitinophaga qingshengii]|uniref:RagB/SusD family nutrient uptake outer membrane protein n=1 Tax=Chitinophaga qingshengii TaxID=1569794 RepID=A0ABR7TXQ7_9BACT|nr:RagB/SusD family nutrient uptake outer membrane protein [Chitinophaga qingshengii]MBC9934848.1 RagB/SusD family nutrient uptake outer membrane protein [Chitinophaga qingshengii]